MLEMSRIDMAFFNNRYLSSFRETVALLALMISLVALSIDTVLPALAQIGRDLGSARPNDNQYIIATLIFGMAAGQMFYGPLSDAIGRKPAIYLGFAIYIAGSVISAATTVFEVMLAGRVLQGLGAAGPRIVTLALVRDQYVGAAMAQVMSIIMSVFIMVPVVAPTIGQAILMAADWRAIFWVFVGLSLFAMIWFGIRQPETLTPERRIPFTLRRLASGIREVATTRKAMGYTLAAGFVFGAFFGYLNSSQQVLQEFYGLGPRFPLAFGSLALSLGAALWFNTRLVNLYGMRLLIRRALAGISILSCLYWVFAWLHGGTPPLWTLMTCLLLVFFCIGLLFGNLNAIAMEPLGHIAGMGAAMVGSLSTLIAVPLGILIGQLYNHTVLPLIGGFALFNIIALLLSCWADPELS